MRNHPCQRFGDADEVRVVEVVGRGIQEKVRREESTYYRGSPHVKRDTEAFTRAPVPKSSIICHVNKCHKQDERDADASACLASIERDIERDDSACISRHLAFALAPNKEAPGFRLGSHAKNREVGDLTLPPMAPIWLLVNSRTFPMECDPCKPHSARSDCISSGKR